MEHICGPLKVVNPGSDPVVMDIRLPVVRDGDDWTMRAGGHTDARRPNEDSLDHRQIAMLQNDKARIFRGFDEGVNATTDRNIGINADQSVTHCPCTPCDIGNQAVGLSS